MRALVSFTLKRNMRTNMRGTRLLGYSSQPACSGCSAGFISTCFLFSNKYKKKNVGKFRTMTGNGHIELLKVTKYNFQPSRPR